MAQQSGSDINDKFNDPSTGDFKTTGTKYINALRLRGFVTDVIDSFVNWLDHVLDEDDMASNSATHVPTQQSVRQYVLGLISAGLWKTPVVTSSTGNVTLSGVQTLDGIGGTEGLRVLLLAQTDQTENGIWLMSAGAWTRAGDADSASELNGAVVKVLSGSANGGKIFEQTTYPVTLGSSNIVWSVGSQIEHYIGDWAGTTAFPDTGDGGNGTAGAPAQADKWRLTGTLSIGGNIYAPGTIIEAAIASPGQTLSNWNKYAMQL